MHKRLGRAAVYRTGPSERFITTFTVRPNLTFEAVSSLSFVAAEHNKKHLLSSEMGFSETKVGRFF